MSIDPLALLIEVDRATERLLRTVTTLDAGSSIAADSTLPGWTRGHILTHVARNADGLVNLLTWARTGVVTPQYPSWEQRNQDIEAGAGRSRDELIDDVRTAAGRFAAAAAELPVEAWATRLDIRGALRPAAEIVWWRLRELEIHHVDLAAGYSPSDWPDGFAHRLLHDVVTGFADRDDVPALVLCPQDSGHQLTIGATSGAPVLSGPGYALASWLIGRSTGTDLSISPPGDLPTPPAWI